MIIGEKLPKNSIFIFAVHKKGSKSNFMEQNTFFRKIHNLCWQTSELQNIVFSLSQTCWDTLYYLRCVVVYSNSPSFTSVVMCVIKAKFFTRPQDSPSGVSEGHNIPHCEGCKDLGPLTFLVFSNWELTLVIIPSAEM